MRCVGVMATICICTRIERTGLVPIHSPFSAGRMVKERHDLFSFSYSCRRVIVFGPTFTRFLLSSESSESSTSICRLIFYSKGILIPLLRLLSFVPTASKPRAILYSPPPPPLMHTVLCVGAPSYFLYVQDLSMR